MDLNEAETAVGRELNRHFMDQKNSTLLVTACRCGHRVSMEEGWSEHIAVAVTAAAAAVLARQDHPLRAAA